MEKVDILAIVPARAGSKRIPRKNLRLLGNETLISRAIDSVQKSGINAALRVSTDCPEMMHEAEKKGLRKTSLRPPHLSTDDASMTSVVKYELDVFSHEFGYFPEFIGIFQPTSPFRSEKHVAEAFAKLQHFGGNGIISVVDVGNKHIKYGYDKNGDPIDNNADILSSYFIRNGAIYIVRTSYFLSFSTLVPKGVSLFEMSSTASLNIDTFDDLELALQVAQNVE